MSDFIALYRGPTIAQAELIAVTAEQRLVRRFFIELLGESRPEQATETPERTAPASLEVVRD